MQETSLAQEIADSFLAKSVDNFLFVRMEDLRLVDILVDCVFLAWVDWLVTKH